MNRRYEFLKMYYDWIIKCLTEDEQWEVLAFFILGCELCVRQKELVSIEWNQIQFPYINNIKISKMKVTQETEDIDYYQPKEISQEAMDIINKGCDKTNDKIFNNHYHYYIDKIKKSCGDEMFSGHIMRTIGITFLSNQLNSN